MKDKQMNSKIGWMQGRQSHTMIQRERGRDGESKRDVSQLTTAVGAAGGTGGGGVTTMGAVGMAGVITKREEERKKLQKRQKKRKRRRALLLSELVKRENLKMKSCA